MQSCAAIGERGQRLATNVAEIGIVRPRATLLVSLLLVVLAALGAVRLSFDPRYGAFFEADDPQRVAYDALRELFAASDTLAFLLEPPPGGPFGERGLAAVAALADGGWQLPHALRVDSILNVPWLRSEGDLVTVSPLIEDPALLDAAARAERERVARSMPEVAGRLLERDGPLTAVVVTLVPEGDPLATTQRVVEAARALARRVEREHPGARVHLAGIVAMNHAFAESSLRDSSTLLPAMLAVMMLLLGLVLRSFTAVAAIVVLMVGASAAALGVGGWAGIALTTASALAPIVIVTVAVADGVHLVLGARGAPDAPDAALRASLEENRGPILLTTATTVAGFLSLNFSEVPPFRDLGNLVAAGVAFAGLGSLTLLPALLRLLPFRPAPEPAAGALGPRLAEGLLRRRAAVLLGAALVLLVVLPGLARLRVNDDFVAYFGPDLPFRTAAELADDRLAGPWEIEYQLRSEAPRGIHDPAFLAQLAAFTDWLRAQPETAHVLAWTDVLARLERVVGEGEGLPPDAERAAQYTFLYEASLPFGTDVTTLLATDRGSVRQLVALRDVDARALRAYEDRAGAWLAAHAPQIRERHGGVNLMFAHVSERNVRAMIEGNLLAVLVIGALLGLALRSAPLAGLSLLTNLVPLLLAFALWGWFVRDVGLALGTVFGMTLGIVVDDTVHVLARYRRARRTAPPREAAALAVTRVGPALVVTTGTLVAGFACLAASSFAVNAQLAQITLLTLVAALAVDLLVLPALLGRGARRTDDSAGAPG